VAIAVLCAVVILGTSTPFVVLVISNSADGFGVAVPIPTDCAKSELLNKSIAKAEKKYFIPGVFIDLVF
jgi:hypothetical protein